MKKILFTRREREVLKLMAQENTTQQIAAKLGIAAHTVNSYRTRINHKIAGTELTILDCLREVKNCTTCQNFPECKVKKGVLIS